MVGWTLNYLLHRHVETGTGLMNELDDHLPCLAFPCCTTVSMFTKTCESMFLHDTYPAVQNYQSKKKQKKTGSSLQL